MKQIVLIPNIVLTTPAKEVTVFDAALKKFVADMKETLANATNPKGVGLAATQVGVSKKVFITKPNDTSPFRAFINPVITDTTAPKKTGKHKHGQMEGCLSIPKLWGNVHRAPTLTLTYQDEDGKTHTETFDGFMATIIQHETDHVNGILFTQRVLEQRESLYQAVREPDGKEVLEEIELP